MTSSIGADQVLMTVILRRPSPQVVVWQASCGRKRIFRFYWDSVSIYRLPLSSADLKIGIGLGREILQSSWFKSTYWEHFLSNHNGRLVIFLKNMNEMTGSVNN
jgi:hypothetical protein